MKLKILLVVVVIFHVTVSGVKASPSLTLDKREVLVGFNSVYYFTYMTTSTNENTYNYSHTKKYINKYTLKTQELMESTLLRDYTYNVYPDRDTAENKITENEVKSVDLANYFFTQKIQFIYPVKSNLGVSMLNFKSLKDKIYFQNQDTVILLFDKDNCKKPEYEFFYNEDERPRRNIIEYLSAHPYKDKSSNGSYTFIKVSVSGSNGPVIGPSSTYYRFEYIFSFPTKLIEQYTTKYIPPIPDQ